jgi:hypothetical protein
MVRVHVSCELFPCYHMFNFGCLDSVGYVFKKLIDCGILSMPVLDVETVCLLHLASRIMQEF